MVILPTLMTGTGAMHAFPAAIVCRIANGHAGAIGPRGSREERAQHRGIQATASAGNHIEKAVLVHEHSKEAQGMLSLGLLLGAEFKDPGKAFPGLTGHIVRIFLQIASAICCVPTAVGSLRSVFMS